MVTVPYHRVMFLPLAFLLFSGTAQSSSATGELWLGLPSIPTNGRSGWLTPGVVTDPSDPKLGHLYGLNLSRVWMLHAIARSLPSSDPRGAALIAAARTHHAAGMTGVTGEHYEGGHWLGTFAVYFETSRGVHE